MHQLIIRPPDLGFSDFSQAGRSTKDVADFSGRLAHRLRVARKCGLGPCSDVFVEFWTRHCEASFTASPGFTLDGGGADSVILVLVEGRGGVRHLAEALLSMIVA